VMSLSNVAWAMERVVPSGLACGNGDLSDARVLEYIGIQSVRRSDVNQHVRP
jgi:hypothetical protein